jgi:dethiobiotin synthetase
VSARGLFIAGTSTEVGKTHVAAMIARAMIATGRRVGVYKPVASGCKQSADGLVSEDAEELWRAANRPGEFFRVCPQTFTQPLSPPVAAAKEGKTIDRALLRDGLTYWRESSDIVLVEGAGGLMSPLSEVDYNLDLAAEFGFPLVIVAANRLGVVNDALQTLITARARAPQLVVAGLVLNQPQPRERDLSLESNVDEVRRRCDAPFLATVWHGQRLFHRDHVDWFALASP